MEQAAPRQEPLFLDPAAAGVSLRGYYLIALVALGVGLLVVLLLNLATPLDYLRARMLELWGFLTGGGSPGQAFFMLIAIPLVLMLACLLALLNMR